MAIAYCSRWLTNRRRYRKKGGRIRNMGGVEDIPRELAALFVPQAVQLEMRLERCGAIWVGRAVGDAAEGTMWLSAPTSHCLVLHHDVTPRADMELREASTGPYACACALGGDALRCSRTCGLPIRPLGPGAGGGGELATFVERAPREHVSSLLAGRPYRSRSIIVLPEFFDELDRRYPGEFSGVFSSFGDVSSRGERLAIARALAAVPERPPREAGGELALRAAVDAMAASLAASRAGGTATGEGDLVRRARDAIELAVGSGEAPTGIGELADRLYVSRSRLCAAFKRETGESVGAFGRRLRAERACELLRDRALGVADVAGLLGYPSPSAFDHAFSQAMGMSPSAWRKATISSGHTVKPGQAVRTRGSDPPRSHEASG